MVSVNQIEIKLPPTIARGFILALVRHIDVGPQRGVEEIELRGDSVILKGRDPVGGLADAINLIADYIADQAGQDIGVRLPMSGNDKGIVSRIFQCYQASLKDDQENLAQVVRQIGSTIYKVKCDESKLPSILKPEMYEYTRIPGYLGGDSKRKFDEEYPAESVVLALIGYLGARVGGYGERRAVALLPPDEGGYSARYFFERYSRSLRNMWGRQIKRRMRFPGINPEPALTIWLALQLPEVDKINLVSIREPAGQESAMLISSLSLTLDSVKRYTDLWECVVRANEKGLVEMILERALNPDPRRRSDLAVKASVWLYETLVGVRRFEETVYMMSRDYVSALLTNTEAGEDARILAMLARSLYRCYSGRS